MKKTYEYVGTFKPRVRINSFSISIYKHGDSYYVDNIVEDKINDFFEIKLPNINILFRNSGIKINLNKGDNPIYSYINEEVLIYGDYFDMQKILLPFLKEVDFTPTAKLLISSFLKIHNTTEKYIEETQKLLNRNGLNLSTSEPFPSNAIEIDKIDELKHYEKFLSTHDPENKVDYYVFRNGENVIEVQENPNSDKLFLYFKNRKISMGNIENIVKDASKNSWLLKFLGHNYDAPNFHQQINSNDIIYNELLSTNRVVLDDDCLIKAISPTIRDNPKYLEEVKHNQSIWHLNQLVEDKLTFEFNLSPNIQVFEDTLIENGNCSVFNDFFSIPDKINPLL